MSHDQTTTTTKWRTLKNIVAHYMYNSHDNAGRSGREVIQQCFKQREVCTRIFEAHAKTDADRLAYENEIRALDELIDKTHGRILRLVSEQAKNGKWVAFGRRNPEADYELIATKYWPFLKLDLDTNTAKGDSISFHDLRCCFASELPADSTATENTSKPEGPQREQPASPDPSQRLDREMPPMVADAPSVAPMDPNLGRNDGPGRPSYFHLVIQEFERRTQAGLREPSLNKQAEVLADWFKTAFPGVQAYAAKTIRNRLREPYRAAQKPKANAPSK